MQYKRVAVLWLATYVPGLCAMTLHDAIDLLAHGNESHIRRILDQDPSTYKDQLETPNRFGNTPLLVAIHNRNIPITKLLLAKGANPNTPSQITEAQDSEYYNSPLHIATWYASLELVQTLLDAGADCTARNSTDQTVLRIAIRTANAPIIQAIHAVQSIYTPSEAPHGLKAVASCPNVAIPTDSECRL